MKLELNQEQSQVLVGLLDQAVRNAGLQAAESAVFFLKMIEAAAKIESQAPPLNQELRGPASTNTVKDSTTSS